MKIFIPTTDQIRAGINSLEGIDEMAAHDALLKALNRLSGDERALAEQAADTGDDQFAAGFLLGLATARQREDQEDT